MRSTAPLRPKLSTAPQQPLKTKIASVPRWTLIYRFLADRAEAVLRPEILPVKSNRPKTCQKRSPTRRHDHFYNYTNAANYSSIDRSKSTFSRDLTDLLLQYPIIRADERPIRYGYWFGLRAKATKCESLWLLYNGRFIARLMVSDIE
jgi:hypothetical protein